MNLAIEDQNKDFLGILDYQSERTCPSLMSGRETFFNFILFPDFSPTRGRKSLGDPLPLLLRLLPLLKSYPIAIVKDNLTLVQVSTKSKKVIISQLYRFYIRN